MIYFLQAEIIGRIKIGYSSRSNIESRVAALQTASPVKLNLLGTRLGSIEVERSLHLKFAEYRIHGEWFEPGPRLVRYIAKLQGRIVVRDRKSAGPKRRDNAKQFLSSIFRDFQEIESSRLFAAARDAGISRSALFEAKQGLPLSSRKVTFPGGESAWVWRKGDGWPAQEVRARP